MICRLCGGSDLKPLYTQGARGEFAFFRCRTCRLVSYDLSAGLDQEKYSRELPDPMSSDDPRNASQSRTYSFIARRYARPGRLLDIGCGNGRLLHLAASDGWEVEGVEMPGGMAEKTAARLGVPVHEGVFPGSMPVLEGRFDLVVLRHVLEHIPDPPPQSKPSGHSSRKEERLSSSSPTSTAWTR
ncbi:MAG TPA: class I SAM-dependent methyltransferase [Candidatus Fermentibacter daniensis]|nr:class I SAM-dependent methyltransferase [Candidatus Fermentibacter daniensis]HQM40642.1 class I SAM-dependent methyltransferase [Candidatus Fermentibacter daniensis]